MGQGLSLTARRRHGSNSPIAVIYTKVRNSQESDFPLLFCFLFFGGRRRVSNSPVAAICINVSGAIRKIQLCSCFKV